MVVSYNTRDLLRTCLDSVVAAGPDVELVVVDNASTDGSADLVAQRYPAARLIRNRRNVGFAAATNQGTRAATGQAILWLNSDAWLLPGALDRLRRVLDDRPEVGAVGPRLRYPDGRFQPSAQAFPGPLAHLVGAAELYRLPLVRRLVNGAHRLGWDHDCAANVDWLTGACLLVRRACLDAVGLLDEGYAMYAEELDWCYRAWRSGWAIRFEPAAEVVHVGGASSTTQRYPLIVVQYRSLDRFCRLHYPPERRAAIRAVTVGITAAKVLLLGLLVVGGRTPRRAAHLRALRRVLFERSRTHCREVAAPPGALPPGRAGQPHRRTPRREAGAPTGGLV